MTDAVKLYAPLDVSELVTSDRELSKQTNDRRNEFDTIKVLNIEESRCLKDGYHVIKRQKLQMVMAKRRKDEVLLENRIWCILRDLGYSVLNKSGNFYLPPKGGSHDARQIDVFAKDDDTVVIAECKFRKKAAGENVSNWINDLAARRQDMEASVREHYNDEKLKFIVILCSNGVKWTEFDYALAKQHNINIVTEAQLGYFEENARHLGELGRYQFHANFLEGQTIGTLEGLRVDALEGIRPDGRRTFVFHMKAKDFLKVAFVNHRKLSDPDSAPSYQRLITKKRQKALREFVDKGGEFHNPITVSIREDELRGIKFERFAEGSQCGILTLPPHYNIMQIIDGQHRSYGTAASEKQGLLLKIVAIVNPLHGEEARLFRDINKEQRHVNASLLGELEGDINWEAADPKVRHEALCSRIADMLVNGSYSPLWMPKQKLTLAEVKKAVSKSGLVGQTNKNQTMISGVFTRRTSEESLKAFLTFMTWWFESIRTAAPEIWNSDMQSQFHGGPHSNVFVSGHILFVASLFKILNRIEERDFNRMGPVQLQAVVQPYLNAYTTVLGTMTPDSYKLEFGTRRYGSGGPEDMNMLISVSVKRYQPEINSTQIADFIKNSSAERVTPLVGKAKEIAEFSLDWVKKQLEEKFLGRFFQLGSKESDAGLLSTLGAIMKKEEGARGDNLADYLEFKHIVRHLLDKPRIVKHLKEVLKISTAASNAGANDYAWLATITGILSPAFDGRIDDIQQSTIQEVFAHLTCYGIDEENVDQMQKAA